MPQASGLQTSTARFVHWVHHPKLGDSFIDTGCHDFFAKPLPYGNYTDAIRVFNWINGVTNRQEPGTDLRTQLAHTNVDSTAVFFMHLDPDHTGVVPALGPQTRFVFDNAEARFLTRAAVANHCADKSNFSTIDFSVVPAMGSSWAHGGRLR